MYFSNLEFLVIFCNKDITVTLCCWAEYYLGSCFGRELEMSTNEVSMEMGLEYVFEFDFVVI